MATQASLFEITGEIIEILTCPICCERYDDADRAAKFLPCLHGFCLVCLDNLTRRNPGEVDFQCPLCRRDTAIPRGGVREFPDNFIAKKLKPLERILNVDVTRPEGLRCGSCIVDGDPAVSFCSDAGCVCFLCESCDRAHRTMHMFEGHIVSSLEQLQQRSHIPLPRQTLKCEQHRQDLSMFCDEESCQRAMCLVCFATAHNGHSVLDLERKSTAVKEELKNLAGAVADKKVKCEGISRYIDTEIKQTADLLVEMSSTVSSLFDSLKSKLETRKENVLADLTEVCFKRTNQLKHQNSQTKLIAAQMDSASQFADKACETGSPVDLLMARGQIISRLHELIAVDVERPVLFSPTGESFIILTERHGRVLSKIEELIPSLGHFGASNVFPEQIQTLKLDFPIKCGTPWVVGEINKVRIRADGPSSTSLDRLLGMIHAYLESPDGSRIECKCVEICGDCFELALKPLVAGLHQLNISLSRVPIEESPFLVDVVQVSENQDPGVEIILSDAFAGAEHVVFFKLRGPSSRRTRLSSLSARYFMPGRDQVQAGESSTEANSDRSRSESEAWVEETDEQGTYRLVYTPPAAGKVYLTIFVDSKPTTETPFVINVNPLNPNSTQVVGNIMGKCPPLTAVVNMPYTVTLTTRDWEGKRLTTGGYNVTAMINTPRHPDRWQQAEVVDNQDGSYKVIFTPRSKDRHIVDLKICGYKLEPGMPLIIAVEESLPFKDPPDGYAAPSGMAVDIDKGIVYVEDAKQGCIHRLATDGGFMPGGAISISVRKKLQIAVNSEGKLVLLVPNLRCVITCTAQGEEEHRWVCAGDNAKPVNVIVSSSGNVVIGDSKSQTLFIYRATGGDPLCRIPLPPKSLTAGVSNVCVEPHTDNIIVATHSEPYKLLEFAADGGRTVWNSPAQSNQLALASMPSGATIVAVLGSVLVLGPGGPVVVRKFPTEYIYTGLALAEEGFFLAFDPGEKHLVKYSYTSNQSDNEGEIPDSK
ncbi:uncharacterized protein LOC110985014 [Acanthaster planci]|uniref:Uncharacterized protein LOC110985014 n=1 Tax=Acanthaster planci TaxID=133434 RepID=A0A8B7Z9A2_ACAPL|nr:uncharacterized protein LOC110985014 [Acanthaster planci]